MKETETHEWVAEVGVGRKRVGLKKEAVAPLEEIVYVELPEVGSVVAEGEEIAVLESTKAATAIYTPASGRVVAVNTKLQAEPGLLNTDPEGEGWLFEIAGD